MRASSLILNVPNGSKRGYAAELIAATYIMGQGWEVAFAAAGCPFDLVAVKDGKCKTIQVKLAWNKDGRPLVSLSNKNRTGKHTYAPGSFDVFCFVVPHDEDGTVDVCFCPLDGTDARTSRRIDDEILANCIL